MLLGTIASHGAGARSGDFDSIATAVGTGSSGTITFSSIPATYRHLQIRYYGFTSGSADIVMKVNSTNGVITHGLVGNGASASSGSNTNTASGLYIGDFGFSSSNPTSGVIDLLDYADTNKNKTMRSLGGRDENGSGRVYLYSGLFDTTSAVDSITFTALTANFTTTTIFALYGIKTV